MNIINSSSTDFMENLSAYWAIQPFDSFNEEVFDNNSSLTAQNLFSRTNKLSQITLEQIVSKCSAEEPFIFVIINSADFKKTKKNNSIKNSILTIKNNETKEEYKISHGELIDFLYNVMIFCHFYKT